MNLEQLIRALTGCMFMHSGKWGAPMDETWHKTDSITGKPIAGSEFAKTFQTRLCELCGAAEQRYI